MCFLAYPVELFSEEARDCLASVAYTRNTAHEYIVLVWCSAKWWFAKTGSMTNARTIENGLGFLTVKYSNVPVSV